MALGLNFLTSIFRDLLQGWSNKKRYEPPKSAPVGPLITDHSIGNYKYSPYDAAKASHQTRGHKQWVDGVNRTGPIWYHAISKGAAAESEAILPTRRYYSFKSPLKRRLKKLRVTLYLHNSTPVDETFIKSPNGKMDPNIKRACTIQANMSGLVEDLNPVNGPTGQYFVVPYDVVVKGDGTKMEAFLQWNEKGVTKRGPATVVPVELVPEPKAM